MHTPEHQFWVFDEPPKQTVVSVSRPDTAGDVSPLHFSSTIELQYKQFDWRLVKKGSQLLYLHLELKKNRVFSEQSREKQENLVKEWLHSFRSLLGVRDSEIGVCIEDKDFVYSSMNGEPWKAGKFEHIHCDAHFGRSILVLDRKRAGLKQYTEEERCHDPTVDFGVAFYKVVCEDVDGKVWAEDPSEKLKLFKGHLVSHPLKFMREEDLRPAYSEVGFYASPQLFQ